MNRDIKVAHFRCNGPQIRDVQLVLRALLDGIALQSCFAIQPSVEIHRTNEMAGVGYSHSIEVIRKVVLLAMTTQRYYYLILMDQVLSIYTQYQRVQAV